jgi:hypothetical protein
MAARTATTRRGLLRRRIDEDDRAPGARGLVHKSGKRVIGSSWRPPSIQRRPFLPLQCIPALIYLPDHNTPNVAAYQEKDRPNDQIHGWRRTWGAGQLLNHWHTKSHGSAEIKDTPYPNEIAPSFPPPLLPHRYMPLAHRRGAESHPLHQRLYRARRPPWPNSGSHRPIRRPEFLWTVAAWRHFPYCFATSFSKPDLLRPDNRKCRPFTRSSVKARLCASTPSSFESHRRSQDWPKSRCRLHPRCSRLPRARGA